MGMPASFHVKKIIRFLVESRKRHEIQSATLHAVHPESSLQCNSLTKK